MASSFTQLVRRLFSREENPPRRAGHAPYKGGEHTRLWRDWTPQHRSGDAAIGENWSLLTSRIRDLCRNDAVMRNLKRALAKHVIGQGIQTFADVMLGEEPDDRFNFESDDLFLRWAEEEADAEGKFSWSQLQWLHFNEVVEVGESFLLEVADDRPGRTLPLSYQLIETEQLDQTLDRPPDANGVRILRGVEYDRRNRPLAYWIYDAHPYDVFTGWTTKSSRIPAARVIHSYLPGRPSENRGVSWLAANVQTAKDLDFYLANELTAAAIGALLTLIVKRKYGSGSGLGLAGDGTSTSGSTDEWGNPLVKLGRGIVADIGADDDIEVAESKRPNRDAEPFIKLILGQQGMAAGLSRLRVTGDYSQSSYTSARGAHLDDAAYFLVLQNWAARSFVIPVRRAHTIQAAAFGLYRSISARQFENRRADLTRLIFQAPGREQLDPEKETNSAAIRIRAGLSTWQQECGNRGLNWRRVFVQQARERAFAEQLGLSPDVGAAPIAEIDTAQDIRLDDEENT